MSQELLDELRVDAYAEQRRARVAQVVEAGFLGQARSLHEGLERAGAKIVTVEGRVCLLPRRAFGKPSRPPLDIIPARPKPSQRSEKGPRVFAAYAFLTASLTS